MVWANQRIPHMSEVKHLKIVIIHGHLSYESRLSSCVGVSILFLGKGASQNCI